MMNPIKNIFLTGLFFALVILLGSCGKENSDVFIPGGITIGADTNWVGTVSAASPVQEMKQLLYINPKIDSCEATQNSVVPFPDGLFVSIPANSVMLPNGQPVSGKIQVEAMLIRKRSEMVRLDKPTVSNGRQLISAGEIYIKLRKNGQELTLMPGKKIGFKYDDVFMNSSIRAFKGEDNDPEKFNWVESQDTVSFGTQGTTHYELSTNRMQWTGLHAFADSSGQRVNVHVSLPVNYTNANTSVYLVYKDLKSMIGIYGNAATKKFISGKLQVGKQATLVVISKQGTNSFYLAHENITIGMNTPASANQVILAHPQPTSLPDIKAYLETLQ